MYILTKLLFSEFIRAACDLSLMTDKQPLTGYIYLAQEVSDGFEEYYNFLILTTFTSQWARDIVLTLPKCYPLTLYKHNFFLSKAILMLMKSLQI